MENNSSGLAIALIPIVIVLALVVLEVWMIIDLIKNPTIPSNQKWLWGCLFLFSGSIAALAYYFGIYRKKS